MNTLCWVLSLDQIGVGGQALKWIESFLTGRMQQVVVNACSSLWAPVTSGRLWVTHMNFGGCRCWLQQMWHWNTVITWLYVDSSHHHLLLEHIYLTFFFLFTSNCPRLLNEYETCVPVSSPKDKNKSYNYRIVLGKQPYLRMHPHPYFGCSVVWAVLCVTTHHERLKIFNKFMSSWVIFIFNW